MSVKIAIIGGSRKKDTNTVAAENLFKSNYFLLALNYVKSKFPKENIRVIDPQHGVSKLDAQISPFDKTIKTLTEEEKKAWLDTVAKQLESDGLGKGTTLVFFCGSDYTKIVRKELETKGFVVETPMKELGGIGYHLQFYKANGPAISRPKKSRAKKAKDEDAEEDSEDGTPAEVPAVEATLATEEKPKAKKAAKGKKE